MPIKILSTLSLLAWLTLAVTAGAVVAFICMNPVGALNLLITSGAFICGSLLQGIHVIVAGIYWVFSGAVATIANLCIALLNYIVDLISAGFFWGLDPIPHWTYIVPYDISPTLEGIIDYLGLSWQGVLSTATLYTAGVQQNAPVSYLSGITAGGGTIASLYAVNPPASPTLSTTKGYKIGDTLTKSQWEKAFGGQWQEDWGWNATKQVFEKVK